MLIGLTGEINKDTSTKQVENIISIISEIRSFKNELNVGPGSFIDMSINNIKKSRKNLLMIMKLFLKNWKNKNILIMILDKPAATWLFQVIYLRFILIKMLI